MTTNVYLMCLPKSMASSSSWNLVLWKLSFRSPRRGHPVPLRSPASSWSPWFKRSMSRLLFSSRMSGWLKAQTPLTARNLPRSISVNQRINNRTRTLLINSLLTRKLRQGKSRKAFLVWVSLLIRTLTTSRSFECTYTRSRKTLRKRGDKKRSH